MVSAAVLAGPGSAAPGPLGAPLLSRTATERSGRGPPSGRQKANRPARGGSAGRKTTAQLTDTGLRSPLVPRPSRARAEALVAAGRPSSGVDRLTVSPLSAMPLSFPGAPCASRALRSLLACPAPAAAVQRPCPACPPPRPASLRSSTPLPSLPLHTGDGDAPEPDPRLRHGTPGHDRFGRVRSMEADGTDNAVVGDGPAEVIHRPRKKSHGELAMGYRRTSRHAR